MANWYYFDANGNKIGPVGGSGMKLMAQNGTISPETLIETEDGKRSAAGKIQGLVFARTDSAQNQDQTKPTEKRASITSLLNKPLLFSFLAQQPPKRHAGILALQKRLERLIFIFVVLSFFGGMISAVNISSSFEESLEEMEVGFDARYAITTPIAAIVFASVFTPSIIVYVAYIVVWPTVADCLTIAMALDGNAMQQTELLGEILEQLRSNQKS